ncbi:MAG: tetratricopeptide repeat protein [Desulfobacteraceae bacterium]|nr:MAG: tetratricopeptide repeat protein [Desulfobacteraceae bacterium]
MKLKEARIKAIAKDFEAALEIYNSILLNAPQNIDALNGKARVLSWMGEYDAARNVYEDSLSKYPENIEALTGLADLTAWQGDHSSAIDLLKTIVEQYPNENEILIRMARYNLWADRKNEAIYYSERILTINPGDQDAIEIREKALKIYNFQSYTGYCFLHMDRNENDENGHNVYTGLKYIPNKPFKFYGQFDYLERFGEKEVRVLGGGSLKLRDELDISVEVGLAPRAEIFPVVSGRIELAYTASPSLVIYGSPILSYYRDVDLYGISVAGEYYPYGFLSLLSRVSVLKTDFEEGGSSSDTAFFFKVTWFINDANKIFTYFSSGSEAYRIETIDRIGGIDAKTFGIGGTYFITPVWGVSPNLEFQDREGGTKYYQFGLEFTYRW